MYLDYARKSLAPVKIFKFSDIAAENSNETISPTKVYRERSNRLVYETNSIKSTGLSVP